jgi:predicted ATPase/class 3 adenylate cyclase
LGSDPPTSTPTPQPPSPTEGERRQLTVLFCDLVGSTEPSSRLDPEDLQAVVRRYQEAASAVIQRYGGYVAQYLGDGMLVYFGYPQTYDDAAERAVRAGLSLVQAVGAIGSLSLRERDRVRGSDAMPLPTIPHPNPLPEGPEGEGVELHVRIGIHTGPVVVTEVGDPGRGEKLAWGETPNVAARVQGIAVPDSVFVTESTYRLISGLFAVDGGGAHALKGIPQPVTVYRVLQAAGVRGRIEATPSGRLTPFVGRDVERRTLVERWEQAREGEGQVVFIVGEAGIGKSRLVRTLREHLLGQPHIWVECAGSPYFANSPFHAITDMLRQALVWKLEVPVEEMVRRLEQSLTVAGVNLTEAVPLVAPLLELPVPEHYPALLVTPEARRKKLLSTLVTWLFGLSRLQPIVVVLEDLHWVDPSTVELQSLFVVQGANVPILFVYTARPEFRAPWPLRAHHAQITLNRLGRKYVRQMIEQLAARSQPLGEIVEQMVARADGVPLFVEELTKAVVEAGAEAAAHGIPDTLNDSLMARLDRMGPAKEVAQTAAVLGREFSYPLLHALSPLSESDLEAALQVLADAELVHVQGLPPDAKYVFKHALVQEAAYESLLKSRRRELHRQVVEVLNARFPQIAQSQPELLAHHYTEAGNIGDAVAAWQQAGEQALAQQAYGEAIAHLRRGLTVLAGLSDGADRTARELALQMPLGQALLVSKGYAAPEAQAPFARARELASSADDPQLVVLVLVGLWTSALTRGEFAVARELASELLTLAEKNGARASRSFAHAVLGTTKYHLGELLAAREHLAQSLSLYDSTDHARGQLDPGVHAMSYAAWCAWQLGFADEAVQHVERVLQHAHALDRPYESAFARFFASVLHVFRRQPEPARREAETLIALGSEQQFPLFMGWGELVRGWALAHDGQPDEGTAIARDGLSRLLATGERLGNSFFFVCVAECYQQAGAIKQAREVVDDALVGGADVEIYDTELHRLRGDLLAIAGDDGAQESYHHAIRLARQQGAKFYELRAATSLARLWKAQGKRSEARELLAPVYDWFTEGFDTQDLIDAKALLEELG